MPNDFNDKWQDIGVLWPNKSGKGYNGKITVNGQELKISVFKNNKTKPNQPELKIYVPKNEQEPDAPIAPPSPPSEGEEAVPF